MNKWLLASGVYILTCIVLQFIPSSNPSYDDFIFKLILSQVYAIPLFLLTLIGVYYIQKRNKKA